MLRFTECPNLSGKISRSSRWRVNWAPLSEIMDTRVPHNWTISLTYSFAYSSAIQVDLTGEQWADLVSRSTITRMRDADLKRNAYWWPPTSILEHLLSVLVLLASNALLSPAGNLEMCHIIYYASFHVVPLVDLFKVMTLLHRTRMNRIPWTRCFTHNLLLKPFNIGNT